MAPPANESEAIYLGHSVAPDELSTAICLSFFVVLVIFVSLYIVCVFSAFQGKFDFPVNHKSLKNAAIKIKLVNPFSKKQAKKQKTDEDYVGIIMNDELNGDNTDTDTC